MSLRPSIDLPKANHGYQVRADEVFWVEHGILRSTDLRDSLDEQCIADIAACIVGGEIIERSKDILDKIYMQDSKESDRILSALGAYGANTISVEISFCIGEIIKVCEASGKIKLRDLLFSKGSTNPFPSVFAVLLIAFHEIIVRDRKKISDYDGVRKALKNLSKRVDTGKSSTVSEERRKNIDIVKGLIGKNFIADRKGGKRNFFGCNAIDIEAVIRRSTIELPMYELKQGILRLDGARPIDKSTVEKIINTICAIANNGKHNEGMILLGVTDKQADAHRIERIDSISPKKVGNRFVVGVNREARLLGISVEKYFNKLKEFIKGSGLSEFLRNSVLSNIDYNEFYGFGVIVINIKAQRQLSYVGENLFWRSGDSTEMVIKHKQVEDLASRFR